MKELLPKLSEAMNKTFVGNLRLRPSFWAFFSQSYSAVQMHISVFGLV